MKIKILFMIMVFMLSIFSGGCGEQSAKDNEPQKKVVVGLDESFPPFGFKDDSGKFVGFDIDLAKETMKRLNYEVEFKAIDWANKQQELDSGNIDMIWNGLEITDERKENILFTKPYLNSGLIVFTLKNRQEKIIDKNSLVGKIIGLQKDSTGEMHLNNDENLKNSLQEIKLYADAPNALEDLKNGKIDAAICDEMNGIYYIFQHNLKNDIEVTNIFIGEKGDIAVGFRKNDTALRDEVQKTLDEMIKDGTAKKISEQWFGEDLIIKN
ncbi:MAG: amino acid ABC transporter substrate-binding protein [Selenomonadaceae bacterium]|nr:amino acid ABC transporter substrate-binding protein [Selenomonadaceae bacterium]